MRDRDTLTSPGNCPGRRPSSVSEALHGSPGLRRNRRELKCLAPHRDLKMWWVVKESTHKIKLKNYKFSEMELGRAVADLSAVRCGTEMGIFLLLLLFLSQYSFVIITII